MQTVSLGEDWQAVLYDDGRVVLQHVSCVIHEDTGHVLDVTKVATADSAHVAALMEHEDRLMVRTLECHPDGSVWVEPGGALSRSGVLGEGSFELVSPTLQVGDLHMRSKPLKQGA